MTLQAKGPRLPQHTFELVGFDDEVHDVLE